MSEPYVLLLDIHVQPGAKHTAYAGPYGDALKIRLAAPPVDGKANQALLRFLAQAFQVPLAQVQIRSGHSGRRKRVAITGSALSVAQVFALQTPAADSSC